MNKIFRCDRTKNNNIGIFCYRMDDLFRKYDPNHIILHTSWNNTDNIIIHLLHKHFPDEIRHIKLFNIDTLDNDFNTIQLSSKISSMYKPVYIYRALNVKNITDAIKKGRNNKRNLLEEPFSRAIRTLKPKIIIQGNIKENQSTLGNIINFNPIYDFKKNSLIDILAEENIPINKLYYNIYIENKKKVKIESKHIHNPFPCKQDNLINIYKYFFVHDFYNVNRIYKIK